MFHDYQNDLKAEFYYKITSFRIIREIPENDSMLKIKV